MSDDKPAPDRADPATLAREAREILAQVLAKAQPSGKPNGIIVAAIPLRFALRDRLDRLCAALGAPPAGMSQSRPEAADEALEWDAACRQASAAQAAIEGDENLWQTHCEQEQDAVHAFLRSRILAGRAPLATAIAAIIGAGAQWGAVANPAERKRAEAALMRALRDALAHGYEGGKAYGQP